MWGILGALLIGILLLSGAGGSGSGTQDTTTPDQYSLIGKVIVLDPGHGIGYPGLSGADGEAEVVLAVAKKTKKILESEGATVYLTNSGDSTSQRAWFANSKFADIFVSIHANGYYDPSVSGVEVFYYNYGSDKLANSIYPYVRNILPSKPRDVKQTNYEVLVYTHMPAALVELEFISCNNPVTFNGKTYYFAQNQYCWMAYECLMKSEDYQNAAATALYKGIIEYFYPSMINTKVVLSAPEFDQTGFAIVLAGGLFIATGFGLRKFN